MNAMNIILLLGGVALFLFGMSFMGDSLKKVAGSKMETVLYKLSSNTLKGVLLGTGVTAVIQSSSATSVMVVGFVNSGMMKIKQGIAIILGAILGTSVTGWVLCLNSIGGSGASFASYFSTEILTSVVAIAGIIFWMFAKKTSLKNVGGIMLGFAVLMFGMSAMSDAISPLKEDPAFIHFLTSFTNPALGVLIGIVITAILQSASASVGILQALAVTGAVEFDMAFPIILGIGIGASVPVVLSALGATINGKRTAFTYLLIDVLGAVICGALFYGLNAIFHFDFMTNQMNMVSIALVNTLYRLATVLILAPCVGILEKLICKMFPEEKDAAEEQADMDRLEPRLLDHPALSLSQSKMVIDNMAEKALESVNEAVSVRREYSKSGLRMVFDLEGVLDRYEDKLGTYLSKVTSRDLSEAQSREATKYLRVLSDFERISDHARNVGESVEEINEKKISFSETAQRELGVLEDALIEISELTIQSFIDNDTQKALRIDPLEEVIDDLCDTLKTHHIERVSRQECTIELGFVFNDLITDYERIADHCSNVALDVIESGDAVFSSHEYHKAINHREKPGFKALFDEYQKKYEV
ncbi:MAG: Na/Pi cotransporter family protein [Parasporobacterium sp.]|nr:Na/Pi cotransporter family protein [Parasporobacterium sp.]